VRAFPGGHPRRHRLSSESCRTTVRPSAHSTETLCRRVNSRSSRMCADTTSTSRRARRTTARSCFHLSDLLCGQSFEDSSSAATLANADPLWEGFSAPRMEIDVARDHAYGVDWRVDGVDFLLDGEVIDSVGQSPGYPMELIIAIFEFPSAADIADTRHVVPELLVREVRVTA
jgi:hypothetical protein